MRALIIYGTTEGHTAHLSEFMRQTLVGQGVEVTLAQASPDAPAPLLFDCCIVAASLHAGNYQAAVVDYARRHHEQLNVMESAFVSVSLSAAGANPDDWEGLDQCVARFTHSTLWNPGVVRHVAGAIKYSRYDFFKRLLIKYIAKARGEETVTSRDYDLTDYNALRAFVCELAAGCAETRSAA